MCEESIQTVLEEVSEELDESVESEESDESYCGQSGMSGASLDDGFNEDGSIEIVRDGGTLFDCVSTEDEEACCSLPVGVED